MSLRKHADKFPDGQETQREIAAMEQDISERIAESIYGIVDESEVSV